LGAVACGIGRPREGFSSHPFAKAIGNPTFPLSVGADEVTPAGETLKYK
jgi:hypothetical protein